MFPFFILLFFFVYFLFMHFLLLVFKRESAGEKLLNHLASSFGRRLFYLCKTEGEQKLELILPQPRPKKKGGKYSEVLVLFFLQLWMFVYSATSLGGIFESVLSSKKLEFVRNFNFLPAEKVCSWKIPSYGSLTVFLS